MRPFVARSIAVALLAWPFSVRSKHYQLRRLALLDANPTAYSQNVHQMARHGSLFTYIALLIVFGAAVLAVEIVAWGLLRLFPPLPQHDRGH
jgi:hypothetical protein